MKQNSIAFITNTRGFVKPSYFKIVIFIEGSNLFAVRRQTAFQRELDYSLNALPSASRV